MTLLEPGVALTDLGLAVEGAVLAVLLRRAGRGTASVPRAFSAFFAALAAAALLGAVEHGLVADKAGAAEGLVWPATLLAVGAAAAAAYGAAARMLLAPRAARAALVAAAAALVAWAGIVLAGERRFGAAIAFYLPAALLLAVAFAAGLRRTGDRRLAAGLAGIGLTFAAAAIQQARIALHARWFDHNALYHVVQAAALVLLYAGARDAPARRDPLARPAAAPRA